MKDSNVFNENKIAKHRKIEVFRARVANAKDYSVVEEQFKYWNDQFKGLENVEVTLIEDPVKGRANNILMQCYKENFIDKVKDGNYKDYLDIFSVRDCSIMVTIWEE